MSSRVGPGAGPVDKEALNNRVVATEIIHDDNVTAPEDWNERLFPCVFDGPINGECFQSFAVRNGKRRGSNALAERAQKGFCKFVVRIKSV